MKKNKIYYNTEYRKKIKALSRFNIFVKDRLDKKNVIREIKMKKEKELLAPIVYKSLFKFYKLIKSVFDKWVYKKYYNLKLSLEFYLLENDIEKASSIYIKNQLNLEYLFNGIIYFLLILNYLWMKEWNKWASLVDVLESGFFNIRSMLLYVNNYFSEFLPYLMKSYKLLIFSILYDLEYIENAINVYNLYSYNSLTMFNALYNIEEMRWDYDRFITPKNKWKDIRKVSFSYFKIDFLNDYFNISFFLFCIYEFYIYFSELNFHYITITFFNYWIDIIIEKNIYLYKLSKEMEKKVNFEFKLFNLRYIDTDIFKKSFFSIRVKYNLFLSNINYFIFFKNLTYNFYIRNCNYFFEFPSHRKLFLKYNNPASMNRGFLSMWDYDKLEKRDLLLESEVDDNLNSDLNLIRVKKFETFLNFFYKKNLKKFQYITNYFLTNFDIRFVYKLNLSTNLHSLISKFFDFNLINFYDLKNVFESYKNIMNIESVYEYRFANSSFKTMDEFISTIFQTPLENYIYFNDSYKNINYKILSNIYKDVEKIFFFEDIFNCYNKKIYKNYLNLLKIDSKLFKIRTYFFKYFYFFNWIKNEESENILRIDIFRKYYKFFKKKRLFFLTNKIKKKDFYKIWSIKKFFNFMKYNTMFYLNIYDMFILFSGWIYEIVFFFRLTVFVKIYNKFLELFNFYEYYKYILNLKSFFFQLMYENVDYCLLFILIFIKRIKSNSSYNRIGKRDIIINNFLYRKYTLYTWLEYNYYNDLFDDIEFFAKENYSRKLSKWILRYFYDKSELYMFYSEAINNNFINKKRLFL